MQILEESSMLVLHYKGRQIKMYKEEYDIWSVWVEIQRIGWVIQDKDDRWYAQTISHTPIGNVQGGIGTAAAYLYERMFPCGT